MNVRGLAKQLPFATQVGAALILLFGASCAPAPQSAPLVATSAPQSAAFPSPARPTPSIGAVPNAGPSETPTPGEFALNLTPLPSETALPTLALPTESRFAGTFEVWDGLPTYLADSQAGFDFRVRYDPGTWAHTTDTFGSPTLAHRAIAGCLITPTGGRGLPLNGTVTHDVRRIGGIGFQVNTIYLNGIRQFVNYVGGDGVIYTAFQVAFADAADQCLADAEVVLGTLKAVSVVDAMPVATP